MKKLTMIVASIMLSFGAHAADKGATQKPGPSKTTEWTKEQRETMAKSHDSMAACLRSDKAIAECRDEMMKSCKDNDACPMNAHMGKHRGMMQDGK
jgi:hypothetical protein